MKPAMKKLLLSAARRGGVMRLARRLTGARLRILCYHGISLADEHRFRGRLFMHPDTFADRMRWLKTEGYPVLPLDEALDRLAAGTLPEAAIVLTLDDGWKGTYWHAFPILRELGLPATLYVTTYYAWAGACRARNTNPRRRPETYAQCSHHKSRQ